MSGLHAILVSTGTDGDVFPYIALGATLRARGHRVTLVANEHFRESAAEHDFDFRVLCSDDETNQLLSNPAFWQQSNLLQQFRAVQVSAAWGGPLIERQYAELAALAGEPGSVLVANPGILAARLVQETRHCPMASIVLQPWLIPSVDVPPVMTSGFTLPRWAPRPLRWMYWRLADAMGSNLLGQYLNPLRRSLGLPPERRIFRWWFSPQLVLAMFPEWYGQPPSDWPPQVRLTGFPLYDGRAAASLPDEVAAFCRAGKPPVVFTFGTGMMHAAEQFHAAIEACRLADVRGIFLTKYRNQLPGELPAGIMHCRFASLKELLPRCAAVVHHGGVGTASRALASGTPQLTIPFAFDQLDNALRVRRLGAGDFLRTKQATAGRIAQALSRLATPDVQARCREVAERLADNRALETAAVSIEELARHGSPHATA